METLRDCGKSLQGFPSALTGPGLHIGGFPVRFAQTLSDLEQVHHLRQDRFRTSATAPPDEDRTDSDSFDSLSAHLMVFAPDNARLAATARMRLVTGATDISTTYTGQYYGLSALSQAYPRALEIGRLCQAADADKMPDALRALLAGVTLIAVQSRVDLLFGCTSFRGQDMQDHVSALTWLKAMHLGPDGLRPQRIHPRSSAMPDGTPDAHAARQALPALLRMYLAMGGWVSDHVVVDPDLDTLHVFTAVETAAIPPARSRALLALCPV